jgi:GTP-binding protein
VIPKIAIVGRPNVGKSSIMNMLAGRKVSITDDTPGTTRDRVSSQIILEPEAGDQRLPILAELIDTGGYGAYVAAGRRYDDAGKDLTALTKDIEGQIAKAVHNADLILFVVDTQAGVTAVDENIARLLRQGGVGAIDNKGHTNAPAGSKVVMVANKTDGPKWESHAVEAAALGFGEPLMCSAKNNYMRREFSERLFDAIYPTAKKLRRESAGKEDIPEMKLAIVGKRNAGKSTLVNTMAGEDRVIVSEIAGTTRDAVDVRFDMGGRKLLAIDTAGLRRKKSFADRIEWWALERMEKAIDRADVALLMIDATEPISHVDHQVAHKLTKTYKPCAIVVNKWDLVRGKPVAGAKKGEKITPEHYEAYLRENLKGLWYAPIAFISAKSNNNVKETVDLAFEMMQQSSSRVTTGKLNRVARAIIDSHKPSSKTGLHAKVYYVAQIATNPPTIVLVVNQPVMYTPAYTRFFLNRLREETPFSEVPVRLLIRDRKRHAEIVQKRGENAALDTETGAATIEPQFLPAESYFDEPLPPPTAPEPVSPAAKAAKSAKGKSKATAPVIDADEDEEPVLSEAEAVAAFEEPEPARKPAPYNAKKPRPAAMEAKARSRKRAKGKTAN